LCHRNFRKGGWEVKKIGVKRNMFATKNKVYTIYCFSPITNTFSISRFRETVSFAVWFSAMWFGVALCAWPRNDWKGKGGDVAYGNRNIG